MMRLVLLGALTLVSACAATSPGAEQPALDPLAERESIEQTLDALHAAASAADGARYFALFDAGAVFYGTDAGERWSLEEFRAYARPHFERGEGWSYRSTERHVFLSVGGDTAWFDERLWNEKYGETRGSGVLVRSGPSGSRWRIAQYNLCIPVPNELAAELVEHIRKATHEAVRAE